MYPLQVFEVANGITTRAPATNNPLVGIGRFCCDYQFNGDVVLRSELLKKLPKKKQNGIQKRTKKVLDEPTQKVYYAHIDQLHRPLVGSLRTGQARTHRVLRNLRSSVWLTLALAGSARVCRTRRTNPCTSCRAYRWHGFRIFTHTAPSAFGVTRRSVARIHSPLLFSETPNNGRFGFKHTSGSFTDWVSINGTVRDLLQD